MSAQPNILAALPLHARYLTFQLEHGADPRDALDAVEEMFSPEEMVVGLGAPLVAALGKGIDGLHVLAAHAGHGVTVPSTPAALWVWLRGDDRGDLVHSARRVEGELADCFATDSVVDGFVHRDSRDLSGYVDGTENPTGETAEQVALVSGSGAARDGGSFVAVQQWIHDLDQFDSFDAGERDDIIGRRHSDNEELDHAPESAHVKRTAQEDFDPPAFLVRRSMPWADDDGEGLMFVAFASSLDPFERQMRRMVGADDGIVDALFRFSQPVSSAAFWCPPVVGGALDLRQLQ